MMHLFILSVVMVFGEASTAKSGDTKCGPGYIEGFNGECVKKFVPPKMKECPDPIIRFGHFELRAQGRMASFWCEDGWNPAPDMDYAMCKLGKWDRELPNCVRPGCDDVSVTAQNNGVAGHEEMGGALLRFICQNNDQELVGSQVLGCDGNRWNTSVPMCRDRPTTTSTTTTTPSPRQTRLSDDPRSTSSASKSYSLHSLSVILPALLLCWPLSSLLLC